MKKPYFHKDIQDFLFLLFKYKVKYIIVGGEAVIYYGHARLTGDIDIFYGINNSNINKLFNALSEFWEEDIPGLKDKKELGVKGMVIQFGLPPNRIDLINLIGGVSFDEAWKNKIFDVINLNEKKVKIYYIGLNDLIKNKRAVKRNKDEEDLKFLIEAKKKNRKIHNNGVGKNGDADDTD